MDRISSRSASLIYLDRFLYHIPPSLQFTSFCFSNASVHFFLHRNHLASKNLYVRVLRTSIWLWLHLTIYDWNLNLKSMNFCQTEWSPSLAFAQLHKLLSETDENLSHLFMSNGESHVCADDRGTEAALLPGCVQKQFGDGWWADIWLWKPAGSSAVQQRFDAAARVYR